jgi:hypothetical protein
MGGCGMYSSASDCMKLLMALLQNDGLLFVEGERSRPVEIAGKRQCVLGR